MAIKHIILHILTYYIHNVYWFLSNNHEFFPYKYTFDKEKIF